MILTSQILRMIVNEISLGFGLLIGQTKGFEDKIVMDILDGQEKMVDRFIGSEKVLLVATLYPGIQDRCYCQQHTCSDQE